MRCWHGWMNDAIMVRTVALGLPPIGDRLYALVFVDRPPEHPTERRIISLRKANQREVKHYVQNA